LADFFLRKYSRKSRKQINGFSQKIYDCLLQYDWPGNVRELENAIERAVAIAQGNFILAEDLPLKIIKEVAAEGDLSYGLEGGYADSETYSLSQTLQRIEKEIIVRALNQTGWNLTKTAKRLGLTFRSLRYRIQKLGLKQKDCI